MQYFDRQIIVPRNLDCFLKAVLINTELGRFFPGVMEARMITGSQLRIDADTDGPSRTALSQTFDGADGITVNPDMGVALQTIEILV